MNAEEVTAMIDAITEGTRYVLPIAVDEHERGTVKLNMALKEDSILFFLNGVQSFAGLVEDERQAREIAAALIAWANRKSGNPTHYVLNPPIKSFLESEPREDGMFHTRLQFIGGTEYTSETELTPQQIHDGVDFYLNKLRNLDGE